VSHNPTAPATLPRPAPGPPGSTGSSAATDGSSALAPFTPGHARSPLHVVPSTRSEQAPDEELPAPPVRLMLRGLLEVLSGWRPAAQMALRVSPEIAADLLGRPRRQTAAPTPQVLRLRVIRVSDSVVETCAVLRRGRRAGALAMRMEFGDRGWLVTRLQVG
jgi:hypothetical protein